MQKTDSFNDFNVHNEKDKRRLIGEMLCIAAECNDNTLNRHSLNLIDCSISSDEVSFGLSKSRTLFGIHQSAFVKINDEEIPRIYWDFELGINSYKPDKLEYSKKFLAAIKQEAEWPFCLRKQLESFPENWDEFFEILREGLNMLAMDSALELVR